MVTPDKDFAQLRKYIHVQPARMGNGIEIWVSRVWKFQIERPRTSHRFLGNDGDAADNIQDYQA
jgi:hypothetical protein